MSDARDSSLDPIAIVGMACRFPKAESIAHYWQMLLDGVDAIQEVPPLRWSIDAFYDPDPMTPGTMSTRFGGFVDDVEYFDAEFFGIAPNEAIQMAPQQRLLLEATWSALEDACIPADALAGKAVGTFIGVASFDYYERLAERMELFNGYTITGNAYSVAANRLAYFFDWTGPSVAVDTACSSSLVATHLACQSLRLGECSMAIAGGTHTVLAPWVTVAASKGGFLAPHGRCKTFSDAASGYVRGEGTGIVVLKRLRDALRDGDPIAAVIRGSAVNQDGRSNGLSAPNPAAQIRLLRDAYRVAGVAPSDVGYVEAHGTGTRLGDPIEMNALGSVLREGRPANRPAWVGSVKSNFGHLEASAGVAGLIKAALVVRHGIVPPNLHFAVSNPLIPFDRLPLRVPTRTEPWPPELPRIGAVSSFGVGGTNAHVVLEAPPPSHERPCELHGRRAHLLCISAKTPAALSRLALRYGQLLERQGGPHDLADMCFTAGSGRAHLHQRAALVLTEGEDAVRALTNLASNVARQARRPVPRRAPKIAFVYAGQGSQASGMGAELYGSQPVFRAAVDRLLRRMTLNEPSLMQAMFEASCSSALHRTRYAQPALFVLEVALTEMLGRFGIRPAAVLGHSCGELAAAVACGALSELEASRIVDARAAHMQACPEGAMAAVFTSEERARALAGSRRGAVCVAAVNGRASVVVAGAATQLEELLVEASAQGISFTRLSAAHAFHSPSMDAALEGIRGAARGVRFGTPRVPFISTLTGELFDPRSDASDYWGRQAREPVRFARAVERMRAEGVDILLEIGARPVLLGLLRDAAPELAVSSVLPSAIHGGQGEWPAVLRALADLYERGVALDFRALYPEGSARWRSIPQYSFERVRYWPFESGPQFQSNADGGHGEAPSPSPMATASSAELTTSLGAQPPDVATAHMLALVKAHLETVTGGQADHFHDGAMLSELGVDSSMVASLRRHLENTLGAPVPLELLLGGTDLSGISRSLVDICLHRGASDPSPIGRSDPDRWCVTYMPNDRAPARLFCFHHAGGSAAAYRDWGARFAGVAEVVAVQLPGREHRLREELPSSFEALVTVLAGQIAPRLDRFAVFFGHSLGSYVAFEVARELQRTGAKIPQHLIVSGSWGPRLHAEKRDLLNGEDRLAGLELPANLRDDGVFMRVLQERLDADARLLMSYRHRPRPELFSPITALYGEHDPWLDALSVEAWKHETARSFRLQAFPGGHMFLQQQAAEVANLIASAFNVPSRENRKNREDREDREDRERGHQR
ncbi:type I polyketide synthase [Pendulispora albinea]|uniref:Acyltransferase domain-containing protein n=1 Tax=Pendulispora albinea TaxID=2741071 RepID=A0ABZ2LLM3_9BACT